MKQFFKFTFASALGFLITFVVIILILFGIISSTLSFTESKTVLVSEGSVLKMNLNYPINDRGVAQPNFADFTSFMEKPIGLVDILENIEKAKKDKNIEGIYLDLTGLQTGMASVQEIRNALKGFKESGKFIVSYAENYSQTSYYLASVADTLYLHPEGTIDFKGLNAEVMFFKNMLDKIDVDVQVVRHGSFKSAVEPFVMDHMSEANREQTSQYINSMWEEIVSAISESRKITKDKINHVADKLLVTNPKEALDYKFADGLMYKDEVLEQFRKRLNKDKVKDLDFVSLKKYQDAIVKQLRETMPKNKIAVVFAQGPIQSGEGGDRLTIGSEEVSRLLRKVRKDTTIDAVVFRVNSPGGSALASDVIWRETVLASKEKPFIVSMGDMAASGGYYISCGADSIFANPTTLTGSIGVFGIIPNMKGLLNEKLGLTFDNVKTNENAGYISVNRPMTPYERRVMKNNIEDTYTTFTEKVAKGRNMSVDQVDEIGQGRVWSGINAKENGLVDQYGGLMDAIKAAATKAGIEDDYRLIKYPEKKEPLQAFIDELTGRKKTVAVKEELGPFYSYYKYLKNIYNMEGPQARLPYEVRIY